MRGVLIIGVGIEPDHFELPRRSRAVEEKNVTAGKEIEQSPPMRIVVSGFLDTRVSCSLVKEVRKIGSSFKVEKCVVGV